MRALSAVRPKHRAFEHYNELAPPNSTGFGSRVQTELAEQHFADHYTSRSIRRVLHNVQDLVTGQDDEAAFSSNDGEDDEA